MDNMANELKISVVTVCYNAVDTIEGTILSVINQTYDNVEYIIIDGGSTDGTVDIIRKYAENGSEALNHRHRITYWVSEPDRGIYDAMNKGIAVATGDYINFMNAGDKFHNSKVIYQVFSNKILADVIYGDTYMITQNFNYLKRNLPLQQMDKTLPFGHQASFVRLALMQLYKFDISYKSAADYDFFYRLYKNNFKFQYYQITVAIFDGRDGFSATNLSLVYQEKARVTGNDQKFGWKLRSYLYIISLKLKKHIKSIIPAYIVKRINRYNIKRRNNIKSNEDINCNGEL